MRIRDVQGEVEEPYNLVPLMDMAFNLLIFFMAATSFTQLEKDMRVQLPRTAPFQTMSAPPKQLVINIRRDGTTVVAGKTYSHDELAKLIQTEVKPDPSRAVLVRADQEAFVKHFAAVAELCKHSGISELKFAFLQQESSGK